MDATQAAIDAGARTFPGARVDRDAFSRFLHAEGREHRTAAYAELYLAFACGHADAAALQHFEHRYLSLVRPALRQLDPHGELVDEIRQQLRVRFFVPPRPRILEYVGQGSLEGWVRAAAIRAALDSRRRAATEREHGVDDRLTPSDPETLALKAEHGPAFRAAFEQAFSTLSSRERAVLKLHLIDRASIDQLAALYGIHRATAARWITRIHDVLRERTVMALSRSLEADAASLVKALLSGLEVSIRRRLAEPSVAG